jgi:hypothetical protein
VHFTSSDGASSLPADYTFVAGDNGVHVFNSGVALHTAGSQTVTATDAINSVTGTSSSIAVAKDQPAIALSISTLPSPLRRLRQFKASVSGSVGTPSGSVVFAIDGQPQPASMLSAGAASFTVPQLTIGKHTITAHYNGDTNFQSRDAAPMVYYSSPRPF